MSDANRCRLAVTVDVCWRPSCIKRARWLTRPTEQSPASVRPFPHSSSRGERRRQRRAFKPVRVVALRSELRSRSRVSGCTTRGDVDSTGAGNEVSSSDGRAEAVDDINNVRHTRADQPTIRPTNRSLWQTAATMSSDRRPSQPAAGRPPSGPDTRRIIDVSSSPTSTVANPPPPTFC